MLFRSVKLRRDPKCPICGDNPTISELIDYNEFCGIPDQPAELEENPDEVDVQEMKRALDHPDLGIAVVDVREQDEFEIAKVDGEPVRETPVAARLEAAGFSPGYKGMTFRG